MVITICGSRKFLVQIDALKRFFERNFHVVLTPNWSFNVEDFDNFDEEEFTRLHESFYQKICMSDVLYVMDYGKYVGKDTQREIDYANENGTKVIYSSGAFGDKEIDRMVSEYNKSLDLSQIPDQMLIDEMEDRINGDKIFMAVDVQFAKSNE